MTDTTTVLDRVRGVSPATRDAIVEQYPTLSALALASEDDLLRVRGVGPATARAIQAAAADAIADEAREDVTAPTVDDEEAVASTTTGDDSRRPVDELLETARHLRGAARSLGRVATSAAAAGREQLPKARAEMREAKDTLRKAAQSLASAARRSDQD